MRFGSLLLVSIALGLPACSWDDPEPNVLVIVVDNLRADAVLSASEVPHIERLRQCGLVFQTCFGHTPSTVDAEASLFSGCLPHATGITGDGRTVDQAVPLLAERLAGEGYVTFGAAGDARLRPLEAGAGLARGFALFEAPEIGVESAARTNERLFAQLERSDRDRPWFLFAHYAETGEPFAALGTVQARADVLVNGRSVGAVHVAEDGLFEAELLLQPGRNHIDFRAETPIRLHEFTCESRYHPLEPKLPTSPKGGAPEPAREIVVELENRDDGELPVFVRARVNDAPSRTEQRRRYLLEVEAVDRAIGALLDRLRERDQHDNTLIVLTSNHGTGLGQHAAIDQIGGLYDEILRVPLVMKLPSRHVAAAELSEGCYRMARLVDVTPTILDLLELDALPSVAGRTLADAAERELTAEIRPPYAPTPRFAKRNHRFKLIYAPAEERFEMYDLARDPLELDNVFAVEGHLWSAWQSELRAIAESEFGYTERGLRTVEVSRK